MAVIAVWGGQESNSYVDLTEANSFILTSVFNTLPWTSITTIQQEACLMQATRAIDVYNYIGGQKIAQQALKMPRSLRGQFPWQTSVPGSYTSYEEQRMQRDVQQATCLQAYWYAQNGGTNKHTERQALGIQKSTEVIGPVWEAFTYQAGFDIHKLCSEANALMMRYRVGAPIVRA